MCKKVTAILSLIALVVTVGGCAGDSVLGGPEAAARTAFEEWAQSTGTPYSDVSVGELASDGTFARVRVTAKLRESATLPWLEHQTEIECKKVGSQWQCGFPAHLELSEPGHPQLSPEAVARAFVEAIVGRECEEAESLIPPAWDGGLGDLCVAAQDYYWWVSARVDNITAEYEGPVRGYWTVTLTGEFRDREGGTVNTVEMHVEKLWGRWYVLRAYD